MPEPQLIVTQGPYSEWIEELVRQRSVSGIRLNTIMPIREGRVEEKLTELRDRIHPKPLWVDLKARQLRVAEFANTPYTAVTISHRIQVKVPALVYFDNGTLTGRLVDIDGYKLILEGYAGRMLGPGESVNIIDDSLTFLDPELLTERDRMYVELCARLGIRHLMLSFVEQAADVEHLRGLYPDSVIMAKIESKRGLQNLAEIAATADALMAARGDLYTEIDYPHQIAGVMRRIREVGGEQSVAASRLLESLLKKPVPACADVMDLQFLKEMGYRRLLIGDDLCFQKEVLMRAIRIVEAVWREA